LEHCNKLEIGWDVHDNTLRMSWECWEIADNDLKGPESSETSESSSKYHENAKNN
jgi:hypothetical protein